MSPHVLIIGASVRAAAESARRLRWQVLAADLFGDIDLREHAQWTPIAAYPDGFLPVLESHSVPVIYTGGLENYPEILASISDLWGNRGECLELVRDPFRWTPLLASVGDTAEVHPFDRPPANPTEWLLKPLSSAGGTSVQTAERAAPDPEHFFQRRHAGTDLAGVFASRSNTAQLAGVTRQLVGLRSVNAPPFGYCGSVGPLKLPNVMLENIRQIGDTLASEAGLRGLFGVDMIGRQTNVIPIEINPRYTASVEVLELATGCSLLAEHRSAFDAGAPPSTGGSPFPASRAKGRVNREPDLSSEARVLKLILYAREDVTVPDLTSIRRQGAAWLADIPQPGSVVPADAPFCSILARSESIPDTIKAVTALSQQLPGPVAPAPDLLSSELQTIESSFPLDGSP